MARKLSRVARGTMMMAAAAAWSVVGLGGLSARAQQSVRVAPATDVVENPFTPRATARPSIVVPPAEQSGPRTYQNPFGENGLSARRLTLSRPGSLSRWRRPVALPGDPATDEMGALSNGNSPPAADGPSAAATGWDLLAPGELLGLRAARRSVDEGAQGAAPPDPARFTPHDLQQPDWIAPAPADAADAADLADAEQQSLRLPPLPSMEQLRPSAVRSEAVDLMPRLRAAQADRPADFDPFEAPDEAVVIVSDDAADRDAANGNRHAAPPVRNPDTPRSIVLDEKPDSARWLAEAQQAASRAISREDLAQVVRLCQQGLAGYPRGEQGAALRSLAAWACNRLGELASGEHREDEALQAFETAIEWDPTCWLAIHNRGVSRAEQGDPGGALDDFNRALDLNPGLAVAYRNRGELLGSMGRTEEAVADYNRAIAQLPEDAELRMMRGHAMHRLGRYQPAIDDLDRAIELAPEDPEAYTHRGNVRAELRDFDRAIDDLQQALSLDEEFSDAYRSLAWLLATCPDPRFRDPQQALVAAQRAAQLAPPGDPFVYEALAAAHANAGRFDEAVRFQQEAIAIAPNDFAPQFSARLSLYQQRRPFRNGTADVRADGEVRAASLEAPVRAQ